MRTVALDDNELQSLRVRLKSGEYNGVDIMHAWLAIDELLDIRMLKTASLPDTAGEEIRPIMGHHETKGD